MSVGEIGGTMFMQWRNLYRGFFIGMTDLIPGVSGGTIALVMGIYNELLAAISGIFSKDWKKHFTFLLPLGLGFGVAVISLSKVIDYLLKNYHAPMQFFFLGLILGIIPFVAKKAEMKSTFKIHHYLILLVVGILLATLILYVGPQEQMKITKLTATNVIGLFLAGWVGSMAMILPGISGSFILLVLGFYWTIIGALSNLNIPIILVVGAGVIIGLLLTSRFIHFALNRFPAIVFSIIIGLIMGSVFAIYPGLPDDGTFLVMSILSFFIGLLVASLFNLTNEKIGQ